MQRRMTGSAIAAVALTLAATAATAGTLTGRAVLPAETFAPGPTSGTRTGPANGVTPPYVDKQPVQGFSAVLANGGDGTYWAMSDNGFGSLENSADYHLRVYRIRPDFETVSGGRGTTAWLEFVELRDPDRKIPFAITNHFTDERILTGADFDIESFQRAPDGTLWFGDEFGPWLLHTDATGKVLEAPVPLPDFDNPGRFLRARQNQMSEETSHLRVMNAAQTHARRHGNAKPPVFSPWHVMLRDDNPAQDVENRTAPPSGSGLEPASSNLWDVASTRAAGFPVVVWTVNEKPRMTELLRLGVNGIISDRPDLLLEAVREFDANGDGTPGDYLTADGLIDVARVDAQGHRGARDLRPENTLPAMEAALDHLMTTLEFDAGVTRDRIAVLDHDPSIQSEKCRRLGAGPAYTPDKEVLVRDLPVAAIQRAFVCDRVFRGAEQKNDPALSPVSAAFATRERLGHVYAMPTVQQVFDFVEFYAAYYATGPGRGHGEAARRAKNAGQVRFNIETKRNPRPESVDRTVGPDAFVTAVAGTIAANRLEDRADLQSFDFSTLLATHERYPEIRTVFLFGDFPVYADPTIPGSDDGTNLQPLADGSNTPWLAGLSWPYRSTELANRFRVGTSGGFEGMALSSDGTTLLPLLEAPLAGYAPARRLVVFEFPLATKQYTGVRYDYPLDARGTNIGDYVMFSPTRGLVIERDGSQGNLGGFKAIYEVELRPSGGAATPGTVGKRLAVDLLRIADPAGISLPAAPGDVGLGDPFAFPFVTIEDVFVVDADTIGVLNDNNFPGSVGRHLGPPRRPDDNEFILVDLDTPLGTAAIP